MKTCLIMVTIAYTVRYRVSKNDQKNIINIKSTLSLIIILVMECLVCVLHNVKNSSIYLYPLRCGMVTLEIDNQNATSAQMVNFLKHYTNIQGC